MKPRGDLIPIDRIVDGLAARILELVREILPNGVRDGHEWRCGSLAGEKGQSLAVHLAAPRAGVWKDFAGTDTGDALDLVAQVLFAGDKVASIKWAKGWLGLDGTNPEALRQTRRAVAAKNEDPDAEADIKKRRANSLRIFLSATAELTGTPVESYLAGRGLDIHELPYPPGAIRYHAALYNAETKHRHPAMVAPIINAAGQHIAVHRTWLQPAGGGGWEKLAGVKDPKKTLAPYRGGFIPLWKGITIDPETGEIRKNPALSRCKAPVWVDITEGIEDGLSVVLADPTVRLLVGVSGSNMPNIRLPAIVEGVYLWQQNDPPDSKAAETFQKVVENFHGQGKRVRLARPPEDVKDANDLVRPAAEAKAREGVG